jgi:hypothetical protein
MATIDRTGPRQGRGKLRTEIVLAHLLTSTSVEEISSCTGISQRTIYRCLADAEFKKLFTEAKARILDSAILKLRNYAGDAVDTLYAIMKDQYAPYAARVSAARSIIEFAVETGQVQDLEAKLRDLEARTLDAVVAESGRQLEDGNHDNHNWNHQQEWKANGRDWHG